MVLIVRAVGVGEGGGEVVRERAVGEAVVEEDATEDDCVGVSADGALDLLEGLLDATLVTFGNVFLLDLEDKGLEDKGLEDKGLEDAGLDFPDGEEGLDLWEVEDALSEVEELREVDDLFMAVVRQGRG